MTPEGFAPSYFTFEVFLFATLSAKLAILFQYKSFESLFANLASI